jgi:hypothetical protein
MASTVGDGLADAVLKADEQPGPAHLNFKLSAAGGLIALADPSGLPLNEVRYSSVLPQVTVGRLPDGTGDWTSLPFSATPGSTPVLCATAFS